MSIEQPALLYPLPPFYFPYYGKAKTVTGDVWWHEEQDGTRTLLIPEHAIAGISYDQTHI